MILITGVSGHIGKRMSQRFLKDGIDFIGIDMVDNPDLPARRFKKMDIRDPSVADLMETNGVESIIHLAFCTKPKMDPKTRDDIDLNGSTNIAACAARKGVKHIVFASSGRVYGDQRSDGGINDIDGNYLNPKDDIYAQNKIKVEHFFLKSAADHGTQLAIVRLAIVCWQGGGAGMGDMFKATSTSGWYVTLGNKNPLIQLVHVDDVITGCLNAIGKEGIFDIASQGTMHLVDVFLEAARLGGRKARHINLPEKLTLKTVSLFWNLGLCPVPPLYLKMLGYDITRDLSKTIDKLGMPRYTIQQIVKVIVEGSEKG